jgi:hypothetical protein
VFCYTSWRFYAFSGTNLLTRCHSASFLFSAVFVFQKSYTGNILGIGRNKSRTSYFYQASRRPKMRRRGPRGQAHHRVTRWAAPPHGETAWSTLWRCPFAYKSPRRQKPRGRIAFPQNILQATAIIEARSGGSRSSSRHPAGEGNPCRRPSPPPWSPPEWCVISLPWTTGP